MNDTALPFSSEEFAFWKHHPVTKVVLQFAADYAAAVEQDMVEQWRNGALKLTDEQERRGRVLAYRDINELAFASIENFYRQDDQENAA